MDLPIESKRQPATREVARDGLPLLLGGLALGYAFFAVVNSMKLSPPAMAPVVSLNGTMALVFGTAWWWVTRRSSRVQRVNALVAAAILLSQGNALVSFSLIREPLQNTTVAALLVTAGFFLMSRAWLALVIVVSIGAWLPVAWSVRSSAGGLDQLAPTVFLGVLLASCVHVARTRTHTRLANVHNALTASRERYRQLFEQSKDIVVVSTPDGRVVDVNRAGLELFGLRSKDDIKQLDLARDVYVDGTERDRLLERTQTEDQVRFAIDLKAPSGPIEVEGLLSKINDAAGNVMLLLATARDVTEQRREERELARYREDLESLVRDRTRSLEEEIKERQRAEHERRRIEDRMRHAQKLESLGLLASGVAHDFNNLLVGILGHAGLARLEIPEDSPANQHLARIGNAAQRAGELASQMLAYSGRTRFEMKRCDLGDVVREMAELLRASISKRATFDLLLDDDVPTIQADATQLRQVILNLITNASDALAGAEGTIRVRVGSGALDDCDASDVMFAEHRMGDQFVFLEVTDTGCGMDDATRRRIFDPFFTTKLSGRGLGMASVLGIVRGHRGWISVCSKSGSGSRFVIAFPPDGDPPPSLRSTMPEVAVPTPWRDGDVALVIDDEPIVRAVAEGFLRTFGFEVIVAEHGEAGVERFRPRADEIKVVLLDKNMPGLDGPRTCQALRQIRPDLPVVLSSGDGFPLAGGQLADPMRLPSAILQKPYTHDQLRQSLIKALTA